MQATGHFLNPQFDSPLFAAAVAGAALSTAIPGRLGLPPIGFNKHKVVVAWSNVHVLECFTEVEYPPLFKPNR